MNYLKKLYHDIMNHKNRDGAMRHTNLYVMPSIDEAKQLINNPYPDSKKTAKVIAKLITIKNKLDEL